MNATFSMRPTGGPQRFRDNARISVEGGELIVCDRDGVEHRFSLSGEGAPCLLVQHPIDGVRSTVGHAWAVLDSHRMSFFSTDTYLWSADDFAKLGKAAGLVTGAVNDRPRGTRPDAVDMSSISMPWWKMTLFLIAPLILISAVILLIKAL